MVAWRHGQNGEIDVRNANGSDLSSEETVQLQQMYTLVANGGTLSAEDAATMAWLQNRWPTGPAATDAPTLAGNTQRAAANALLTSIDAKTPALIGGGSPVVLPWVGLSDLQLRANPVPVAMAFPATQAVSAANLPLPAGAATQGTLASVLAALASVSVTGTFWQPTQPVSLAAVPTHGVTGTFWQTTQPVSIATMPSTPVTGAFFQTTQPVSLAAVPTHGVTGTFWQATQPVSLASIAPQCVATTNGYTRIKFTSAIGTNPTVLKASAGRLVRFRGFNASATDCFLKFVNAAAVTPGTTPLTMPPIKLPALSAFREDFIEGGEFFSAGIAFYITKLVADADVTALVAGDVQAFFTWV